MASTEAGATLVLRRSVTAAALLLCILGMIATPAFAEEKKDYALIYGTVWDADSRAISGVPIKIQRVGDKKPKWALVSDPRGEFAQRVPPGQNDYIVTVESKVPKGGTKPQTKVHVHNNERVDISLHLTK
jgi:DNA primase